MPDTKSDATQFLENMTSAMDRMATIARQLADNPPDLSRAEGASGSINDMARTFSEVARDYAAHPEKAIEAQMELWTAHTRVWQGAWSRFLGEETEPAASPDKGDRRFKDDDWQENQVFDFLKQSYLVTARWAHDTVQKTPDMDEHMRHKADFYVDQVANALSPSNFALTNPEVLRLTLETGGKNLLDGLEHLAEDIRDGKGELRIRQTDLNAFKLGRDLALTPGKVVYQNDLMQLIQYEPATEKVYKTPLLIVPPWINKFYILDLNPKKSFIRWAVEQGLTVFVISWVNPDAELAQKAFSDYMREGVLTALDAIKQACGEDRVNAIGYCIGGTLLSGTLGYMAKKGDKRIGSATFFTTQVDFEKAGDLKVFADEEQIAEVEKEMARKGYLEGKKMAGAFNMLRSNDLIWSYVVNNYLKGKEPMPFDLLYWNSDSTRMPAATHSFYLRQCYLYNNMSEGRMELDGETIDLGKVTVPVYNLAAREDHIAPLPSVFRIGDFFGGKTELVVAGSGHIAGVVNPPDARKYQYWTNSKPAKTLDEWLDGAEEHPGSWWPHWAKWVGRLSGKKVKARTPGGGDLKVIEDAPGSYVAVRSE